MADTKHILASKTVNLSGAALVSVSLTVLQQYQSGGLAAVDYNLLAAVLLSLGAVVNRLLEKNNTKLRLSIGE